MIYVVTYQGHPPTTTKPRLGVCVLLFCVLVAILMGWFPEWESGDAVGCIICPFFVLCVCVCVCVCLGWSKGNKAEEQRLEEAEDDYVRGESDPCGGEDV
jgi:hypothetical protein